MSKIKFKSIKTKLVMTFMLLILVPMLSLTFFAYYEMGDMRDNTMKSEKESFSKINGVLETEIRDVLDKGVKADVLKVDERINNLVQEAENIENQVKAIPEILNEEGVNSETMLGKLKKGIPSADYIYIGTSDGRFLINPRPENLPKNYNPTNTEWYKNASKLKDGELLITDSYVSSDGEDLMVTIATPITQNGKLKGVVAVDTVLTKFSESLEDIKIGEDGYTIVTDSKGVILTHKDKEKIGKKISEQQGVIQDGNVYIIKDENFSVKHKVNDLTGWVTYALIPKNEYETLLLKVDNMLKESQNTLNIQLTESTKDSVTFLVVSILILTVVFGSLGYILAQKITKPIEYLSEATNKIAEGDLTTVVAVTSEDELGTLADSVNKMTSSLKNTIVYLKEITGQLNENSSIMDTRVTESNETTTSIEVSMHEVAKGSESLTDNMMEVSTVIDEMSQTMESYSQGVLKATEEMKEVENLSENGLEALEKVTTTMNTIEKQSETSSIKLTDLVNKLSEISKITEMIRGIADQTNLLSLNAQIEAARAGENGRGFAVVALEVKKLADQSKESVDSISRLVGDIQKSSFEVVTSMDSGVVMAKEGTSVVTETTEHFNSIIKSIKVLSEELEYMSRKTKELEQGSQVINSSVQEVVAISEETTASVEEVASSLETQNTSNRQMIDISRGLEELSIKLDKEISKFTL